MFTKEEIALAKPCYEAIKKIAERQETECPECHGARGKPTGRICEGSIVILKCSICKGRGKIKGSWEWEPEWRDLIMTPTGIWMFDEQVGYRLYLRNKDQEVSYITADEIGRHSFPLLHWERIRKILCLFGYSFSITSGVSGGEITVYENIGTDKVYEKYHNNDLQLEVIQAVIELGKEE